MNTVIVDFDNTTQTLLSLALESEGLGVAIANEVGDVLTLSPNIIFIDRKHPIFSRDTLNMLCERISPTPIIVALDSMHGFMEQDKQLPIDCWMQKPFTVRQVQQVLASVI